jgi:hypothetical protein
MEPPEFQPFLAAAESYIHESCVLSTPEVFAHLRQVMDHCIAGALTTEQASALFMEHAGTCTPIIRIATILGVSDDEGDVRRKEIWRKKQFADAAGRSGTG